MDPATVPAQAVRGVLYTHWAYWCSLAMAALSIRFIPPGSVRIAVMVLPLLTAAWCVALAYWIYESCDEYVRARILRCIAWTAAIVAAGTVARFIAELAGAPRLSMLWVSLFGWSVFNLQFVFVILRSR
jgi:hypothetical protein